MLARVVFTFVVAMVAAGCPQGSQELAGVDDDGIAPEPTSPRGCFEDADCELASTTCCECPSFALAAGDPKLDACEDVNCPPPEATCARLRAVCEQSRCEVACEAQPVTMSCVDGFATDAAGCLIDACAEPATECTSDAQCAQTRADCCGCARGGSDTAVAAGDRAAYDQALGCSGAEACPEVSTCVAAETPQCAQGTCKLIAGEPPGDACGRPDLAACPAGKTCTVNADKTADLHGVGVCR